MVIETPIEPYINLEFAKLEEVNKMKQYQRLIGKLIYLSHSHPNISFVISVVSEFMHSLGKVNFEVSKKDL